MQKSPTILVSFLLFVMASFFSFSFLAFADSKIDSSDSILGHLEAQEKDLDRIHRRISELKNRKTQLDAKLGESGNELERARKNVDNQQTLLTKRLRQAYKLRRGSNWEYLLASHDFSDFVLRRHYLSKLWENDRERIQAFSLHAMVIEEEQQKIVAKRKELENVINKLAREEKSLAGKIADKKSFLQKILSDAKLKRKADDELAQARKGLNRRVATLSPSKDKAIDKNASFKSQKGSMPCPVIGNIEIGFGEADRGGAKHFHGGYDIRARDGAPVRSPAKGRVVFAGRMRGFGNLIIIDHGQKYHTLYGHLKNLSRAVGQAVTRGDILGQVGDTGSLKGSYLYFEMRKRGKPQNPDKWLDCRKRKSFVP